MALSTECLPKLHITHSAQHVPLPEASLSPMSMSLWWYAVRLLGEGPSATGQHSAGEAVHTCISLHLHHLCSKPL